MTLGLGLALAAACWLVAAAVYRWLALSALDRACAATEEAAAVPPAGAAVALRPLHGAGARLGDALASFLAASSTARVPVILGVAREDDPAVAICREMLAARPDAAAALRIGSGPPGCNRKMANLIQMSAGVDADLWLLSDADVRVPTDLVARLLQPFKDAEVGLVTCPYLSVPASSLASRLDALVTNTHFLPGVCMALRLEGLHFALGAAIAVRAEALARAGGFERLLDLAADDFELARNVEQAGFRLAWSPLLVDHLLEDEGWRRILGRQLRWARVTRHSRLGGYIGQTITHGCVPALLLGGLWLAAGGPGWSVPLAWWSLQAGALWRRRALLRLRPLDLALLPLADLLAFGVHVCGLGGRPRPS